RIMRDIARHRGSDHKAEYDKNERLRLGVFSRGDACSKPCNVTRRVTDRLMKETEEADDVDKARRKTEKEGAWKQDLRQTCLGSGRFGNRLIHGIRSGRRPCEVLQSDRHVRRE